MPDRWQTFPVEFNGGLITNMSPVQQGLNSPGSAQVLRNFEPSTEGGYRRILGYTKWDDNQLAGSGLIRGVMEYSENAIAARGTHVYESAGAGWTQLTDNATYSSSGVTLGGTGKVRFTKHNFGSSTVLILTDGLNKPYKYDGTTFSQITSAPSDLEGADHVVSHQNHLFFANGKNLVFSAPYSDTDYTAASGGGLIAFNFDITDIFPFREQLIIFTGKGIFLLAGTTLADFQVQPITSDLGTVQSDTVQEVGGDLMFLGPDGLRLLSATERNNDFGLGVVSKPIQSEVVDFINQAQSFSSVIIRKKSQYRIFAYNSNYTDSASIGLMATQFAQQGGASTAWADLRGINVHTSCSEYVGETEFILFANDDGYVYLMESGNSFDGNNIEATFATPYLSITDPTTRKNIYKMKLFVDPQGSFSLNGNVQIDFNEQNVVQPQAFEVANTASTASFFGNAVYGTASYGGSLQFIVDKQLTGSGFVFSFRFLSDSTDPPFSFDSMLLQYGQYGRR